jgi:hypothetical protein
VFRLAAFEGCARSAAARCPGGRRKGRRSWAPLPYGSHMCSTPDARLALIGQAIDKLAEEARTGTQATGAKGAAADDVMQRLAEIWAMVAELDPGVAQRLPRYAAPDDSGG